MRKAQRGSSLVETLVAMSLVAIGLAGSASLIATCFHGTTAARTHVSAEADIQAIIDGYRSLSYTVLLSKFNANIFSITNGQVATENTTSTRSHASFVATLTAIKSKPDSIPEAVRVQISTTHRRGQLKNSIYTYQTIIAQVAGT